MALSITIRTLSINDSQQKNTYHLVTLVIYRFFTDTIKFFDIHRIILQPVLILTNPLIFTNFYHNAPKFTLFYQPSVNLQSVKNVIAVTILR
jgi:hypothetical protein